MNEVAKLGCDLPQVLNFKVGESELRAGDAAARFGHAREVAFGEKAAVDLKFIQPRPTEDYLSDNADGAFPQAEDDYDAIRLLGGTEGGKVAVEVEGAVSVAGFFGVHREFFLAHMAAIWAGEQGVGKCEIFGNRAVKRSRLHFLEVEGFNPSDCVMHKVARGDEIISGFPFQHCKEAVTEFGFSAFGLGHGWLAVFGLAGQETVE